LTSFYKQSVFQTGVISFITRLRVKQTELENMMKMFLALDTSQDGFLTLDEVKLGLERELGEFKSQSKDWQVLIEQLDTNNDGKIDYGEFINAAINKCRLLS
jgi:calcium-dependent protein kinase